MGFVCEMAAFVAETTIENDPFGGTHMAQSAFGCDQGRAGIPTEEAGENFGHISSRRDVESRDDFGSQMRPRVCEIGRLAEGEKSIHFLKDREELRAGGGPTPALEPGKRITFLRRKKMMAINREDIRSLLDLGQALEESRDSVSARKAVVFQDDDFIEIFREFGEGVEHELFDAQMAVMRA